MKVFLGGTCNGSQWREDLKPLLELVGVDYFDPVVDDWNEAAQQRELEQRASADFVLYTITPLMAGVYSIAEAVDDSNKRPKSTLFCVLDRDAGTEFNTGELRSLRAVKRMIERNGGVVLGTLLDVAKFLRARKEGNKWEQTTFLKER